MAYCTYTTHFDTSSLLTKYDGIISLREGLAYHACLMQVLFSAKSGFRVVKKNIREVVATSIVLVRCSWGVLR